MSLEDRDPYAVMEDICNLNTDMGDEMAEALLDANPHLFKYRPVLTEMAYRRTVGDEVSRTRQYREPQGEAPTSLRELASELSMANFNRSAGMFDHLDFDVCRQFVLIGCGWLPTTLFLVHEKTDVPELVGLDIVPEAIQTSNALAKRLGYWRVRTVLQDGNAYDYGNAQIVYLPRMIFPKSTVLSRIADTAPRDVHVLVRESYSLGRLWGETIDECLDPRFEVIGKGEGSATYLTRDVYLRRKT